MSAQVIEILVPNPAARFSADGPRANFEDTDIANGKRLVDRFGSDFRATEERGTKVWTGTHWESDPRGIKLTAMAKETALELYNGLKSVPQNGRDAAYKHARKSQSKGSLEAMVWSAQSEPGIFIPLSRFDSDPMLLNVANGTLDLCTGELRPHKREDLITRCVQITFDPSARCDRWQSFLKTVTGNDDDLLGYLRRMIGYSLTGRVGEQVLHFLYGSGRNGKSVFCETVLKLLGEYAIAAQPEMIMSTPRGGIPNDIARLRGMRVAMMNETNQGEQFNEAKLKELTGSDTLAGRFLYQEMFQFSPTHKLWIRGNHKPTIVGTDEGIWRRMRMVPFTVVISLEDCDLNLQQKLDAELPGILCWAVEGCLEWQRTGLSPPAVISSAVDAYRLESDVLANFIAEHCDVGKIFDVRSLEFSKAFRAYATEEGERPVGPKIVKAEMTRRGFTWEKNSYGRRFSGIGLRKSGLALIDKLP